MKKGGETLLLVVIISLMLFSPLILAQSSGNTTSTTSSGSNQSAANSATGATGINKAYLCLEGKVANTCGSLSTEEQIFSLQKHPECVVLELAHIVRNKTGTTNKLFSSYH